VIPVLHALRIEAKYLRYSLEFTRHLLGPDGDQLITQLKQLQDHLGALNDAKIEQQRLLDWQHQLPANAALTTRLADLETTMARLVADYPPLLTKFVDRKNRTRLAKTLVHL
jgi:CHAD domain-containing protein